MASNERVRISRPKVKGVLAFFLLPQFWRCLGHFSHIGPTFVRTLALMLEQAGLLPINHPATRYYGTSPDGREISVKSVMGEAWFHLRTRKDVGVYQWSMFSSIVMMFAIFIGSLGMALVYVVSGTVANAQLFSLNTGVDTSMASVPNYTGGGGMAGFDSTDPNGDLAIGILNKVLRQAVNDNGGALQDGIRLMYGTYSSAVLIIASVLVFWAIVSIVLDSARTGQFGGGRHNMVWTPIRFALALGLLVPIGNGFNAGQIMVMKLAEMGSNLGSNMWATYLTNSAAAGPDLLPTSNFNVSVNTARTAINPYIDAVICMKKINIDLMVTKGVINANHPDVVTENIDTLALGRGDDSYDINYGSRANHTKCGSVTISNPMASFLVGQNTPVANFERQRRQIELDAFNLIRPYVDRYACAVAAKEQAANPANYLGSPLTCNQITVSNADIAIPAGLGGTFTNCTAGGGGWNGTYPGTDCRERIVEVYAGYIESRNYSSGGNVDQTLRPYVTGTGSDTLINDITTDGWAGMGGWYYNIAKINRTAAASQDPKGNSSAGTDNNKDKKEATCPWLIKQSDFLCGLLKMSKRMWQSAQSEKSWSEIQKAFTSGGFMKALLNIMKQGDSVLLVDMGGWGQNVHPISQIAQTGEAIFQKTLTMYNTMMLIALMGAIPFIGGAAEAILASPMGALLGTFASFGMLPGIMLLYYVPLIPWIRVTFAVLAWIASVVEAVTTMPIVALAHLRTDGDGLAGPMAQGAYVAWLNLLLRPALTVIGFVMGGLIFQAMVLYTNDTFTTAMTSMGTGSFGIVDQIMNTYFYVMVVYALVNASFKLVDIIPNSTLSWLNGPGAQDFSGEISTVTNQFNAIGDEFANALSRNGMQVSQGLARGSGAARGAARRGWSAFRNFTNRFRS